MAGISDSAVGAAGEQLPGEDMDTADVEDAHHWVGVYEQLIKGLKVVDAADAQDSVLVRSAQLRARLTFWRRREKELRD